MIFYLCYEKIRTSFNFRCSHYGQGEYILSQNNKSTDSESLASKVCAFIIYSGFPYTVRTRKSQNKKVRRRAFPLCGALYIRSGPLTKELLLDLDQRGGLFGDLLVSLGQLQLQDAVLELGGNIGKSEAKRS